MREGAHLAFADINPWRTVETFRHNPAIETAAADAVTRKGYRRKGTRAVPPEGAHVEEVLAVYRGQAATSSIPPRLC